ncbi:MAG: response regulator transcription factor [Chloroflexi bacterium]|nr:response regulator transcription factor [Chloroflexota bacterium]
MKKRILIVDDEVSILKFLRSNLEDRGYAVISASNGEEALNTIEMELPDLIVLDVMMPKMDGFEVCRRLREWSQIPIIMLSARGDEKDKVKCLDLGADDYIVKPFGANELMARVSAVLRRTKTADMSPVRSSIASGDLAINFAKRQITRAGTEVKLTPTEYALLQELAVNSGKVLTHTHLLNKVWGPEYRDEREYLHVFVRRLRSKLEPNPDNPTYILTVSGVGYQFIDTG